MSDDDIRWLVAVAAEERLAELEVGGPDYSVLVRRHVTRAALPAVAAPVVAPTAPAVRTDLMAVKAPMAGIFYRSAAPDSPPFVEEGDEVQAGETVALIEAMKLYNDVEAPVGGRVERVLVADASRVAADQDIMLIKPSDESADTGLGA